MSTHSSSNVLLTVDESETFAVRKTSVKYPNIAPRNPGITSGDSGSTGNGNGGGSGLAAIAPAPESRADGTPLAAATGFSGDDGDDEEGTPSKRKRGSKEQLIPGTDEWHRVRRDSHKEVERRRREVINQGIDQLAALIPGAERNKGRIIAQAVEYIHRLQDTEKKNIEKWMIERLLADQAIAKLTKQVEQLESKNKKLKGKLSKSKKSAGEDDDEEDEEDEENGSEAVEADAVNEGDAAKSASRKVGKRRSSSDDDNDRMSVEEKSDNEDAADSQPLARGTSNKKSAKAASGKKGSQKKKGSRKS
ncbi:basic helix-loop-helix protein [Coemansia sp. Benny D160-2]|nr:basic helix-loop-helix protein [Coemansia sp. Benny D160-2]